MLPGFLTIVRLSFLNLEASHVPRIGKKIISHLTIPLLINNS